MDHITLELLRADIERQMQEIAHTYDILKERSLGLSQSQQPYVDSVGYNLHNLYCAIEDLLQIVAKAFENHVTDMSRWHTQLLDRMTLTIEGVRPALLSRETAVNLHKLRAFRHFFRHAYGIELEKPKVQQNLQTAGQIRPLLERDVATFLKKLTEGT